MLKSIKVSKKKSNAKVARFLDLPFPDHPGNSPVLPEMAQTIPPFPESPTISPFAPFPESPTFSPDLPPFPTIPPFPDSPTILSFPHSPTISPFPDSPTIAPFTDSPTIAPFPDSPTILPFPDSPTIPPFPDSLPFPEFSIIPSFPDSSFIQPFPDSPSIQHFPDSLTVPPFPENAQPFPSFPKAMEDRSKLKSNQKRIVYVDLKTNISETPESSNSTIGMSTDRANDRRKQPLKFHRLGDAREVDPSFFVPTLSELQAAHNAIKRVGFQMALRTGEDYLGRIRYLEDQSHAAATIIEDAQLNIENWMARWDV